LLLRYEGSPKDSFLVETFKDGPPFKQGLDLCTSRPPRLHSPQGKRQISDLGSLSDSIKVEEGLSIGGVWAIYHAAKKLGIEDALGDSHNGKLALWQVFSRVLEQGSILSAVRLGKTYAIASTISLKRGKHWLKGSFRRIQ
jgi:hypothetical protein